MVSEQQQPKRSFYSKSAGLCLSVSHGQLKQIGNDNVRVGEKHAQFSPQGEFGVIHTSDPEVIAFLEARILNEQDVFSVEEYNKLVQKPEQRISQLEEELRMMTAKNSLLEKVTADKKAQAKA